MNEQIHLSREARIDMIVEGFKEALMYQGELLADLPDDAPTLHALGRRGAMETVGAWRRAAAPPVPGRRGW